jgi:hypothetical protein
LETNRKEVLKGSPSFGRFNASMSREHVDRKALKQPDNFVALGQRALVALLKQKSVLLGALVGTVVLALAYYGYGAWKDSQLNRGWLAFYQAEEAKEADRPSKWKEAFERGGSTRAAYMAAVSLGDYYYKAFETPIPGTTPEQAAASAAEWYTKALSFSLLLPSERELLTMNLGQALELQKKTEEALASYQKSAAMGGQSKPLALLHVGRLQEAKKDKEAARTSYQSIVADFAMSEYARIARNYLRRMDSALLESEKL